MYDAVKEAEKENDRLNRHYYNLKFQYDDREFTVKKLESKIAQLKSEMSQAHSKGIEKKMAFTPLRGDGSQATTPGKTANGPASAQREPAQNQPANAYKRPVPAI